MNKPIIDATNKRLSEIPRGYVFAFEGIVYRKHHTNEAGRVTCHAVLPDGSDSIKTTYFSADDIVNRVSYPKNES
jgi:hypothetical protein